MTRGYRPPLPSGVPELPEVETIRRALDAALVGRSVVSATLFRRDVLALPSDPPGGFSRQRTKPAGPPSPTLPPDHLLAGHRIATTLRHGKQLALITAAGPCLIIHLGMSGQILIHPADAPGANPAPRHEHARWHLDNSTTVSFVDPRRFGGLWWFPSLQEASNARWSDLGPDALTIQPAELAAGLRGSRRAIKAALLDQTVLAGVGNIYADEALHRAGIHPLHRAGDLPPEDLRALALHIRQVLRAAIRRQGTTLRDYRAADGSTGDFSPQLRVYGRAGKRCHACAQAIMSAVIGQRTTCWCPRCQPHRETEVSTVSTHFPQALTAAGGLQPGPRGLPDSQSLSRNVKRK